MMPSLLLHLYLIAMFSLSYEFELNHQCITRLAKKIHVVPKMGLYDSPLPPRPPPRKTPKGKAENWEDDDDDDDSQDTEDDARYESSSSTLFTFNKLGKEVRGLLPNLGRRLDSGVGCYFEPSDRLVQNLVGKTSCSVSDACWALEACKGDITEAWTRISMARRMQLEDGRLNSGDFDADVRDLEIEEDFLEQKERRIKAQKKQDVKDFFKGGEPDQTWLPRQTKGPMDDEPWFTG